MGIVELITITGVCVAVFQLHLQRMEYRRTSAINSSIFFIQLLKERIDRKEALVSDLKKQRKPYKELANQINFVLLPELEEAQENLIQLNKTFKHLKFS